MTEWLSADLVEAMRNWCWAGGWDDADTADVEVIVGRVSSRYAGGIEQFRRDRAVWQ